MSPSNSSGVSDPLRFLAQNPELSDVLFADCNFNLSQVTTIVAPLLQAKKRCQTTSFYVQAVTTGRSTFLATNLTSDRTLQVTEIASNWLIGRIPSCVIVVPNPLVSRRHAAIGYQAADGFYITDVGSSNGTWVNGDRLAANDRRILQDGDLIRLGGVSFEFFVVSSHCPVKPNDSTCF